MKLEITRKSLATVATMVELVLDDDTRIELPRRAVAVDDRVGEPRKVMIELEESHTFGIVQIEDRS